MALSVNLRHECPRCERVVRGPSFFQHVRICKGKQLDIEKHLNTPIRLYTISGGKLYNSSGEAVMGVM